MTLRFSRCLTGISMLALFMVVSCKENKTEQEVKVHKYTNALASETSPYLLQHAHNPVNWRAWSQEALDDAKKENKLVLVSIGYSSCHWCHVMEDETFENEEVAKIMNENFINIKVDREERPDVDQVYMTALQLISGSGGWPLNVITLPNGKPLYGGTYHTREQWMQVLTKISELYKNDPKKAEEYSDMVAAGIAEANLVEPAKGFESITKEALKTSVANWSPNWDLEEGGEKGVQKFMIPSNLSFLLDYAVLTGDDKAKRHVRNTLDKMALGGVYDQIGGGFYRYSTDAFWKVPHFEKMLYDNAQVLSLYSKAYTLFKDDAYKNVVWETIDFLDREMKDTNGGYHAALDADSEGEEGKFYVWKEEELKSVLGEGFELFFAYYNINKEAVWEDGKYVLHRKVDDAEFVKEHDIEQGKLNFIKSEWNKKLLAERNKRVFPRSDDKIITSWNALLVNGFVDAYKAFGQKRFLEKAESVFLFIRSNAYQNGKLVHTFKKGSKRKEGFIEDYAFMIDASLELYGLTLNTEYLDFAKELNAKAEAGFADEASGMYHYNEGNDLIARIIKTDDGVLPSPNAVMAHNLFRLGHLDYNTGYTEKAKRMLSAMVPALTESAPSYSKWNALLLNHTYPYFEIAVVGKDAEVLIKALNEIHLPNALVVGSKVESNAPLFKDRYVADGTFIYVCRNTTCKLPVKSVDEALGQMRNF
ncbi:thioredoxin domain-containing protein [Zobellia galactanivorans]|uniref:thioredoxin domain-containing protein n=1 Tax=Zobellia galactanivorans (strain DSM 12802 / CCUG 47099 / CIP 106680 / NCIMB 13871 / Dsij) TaxID=63186 RepID=UPI0026E3256E|nr:thioredoxin domain-containing protein [Zobellia galactanivorans]MDO6810756.1 thioredoxin domain-containing protein [Zobellia galactanivorans]